MPRRDGAPEAMGDTAASLARGAGDYWRQGRDALRHLDHRVESQVREHPLMGLAAAVGMGVALGIILTLACPASFPGLKGRSTRD